MSSTTLATSTTTGTASSTTPTPSASSTGSGQASDGGIAGHYFVFFALVLCILGFAGFTFFKRRRKMSRMPSGSRPDTWNRPGVLVTPNNHWLGRWRAGEVSREEGLNEYGEAPPAYVPKSDEETRRAVGPQNTQPEVAVPLQTLSRDAAGLKLPDYSETEVPAPERAAAPGSSRRSLGIQSSRDDLSLDERLYLARLNATWQSMTHRDRPSDGS